MNSKQWDMYASVHTTDHVSHSFGKSRPNDTQSGVQGHEALTKAISTWMEEPVPMTSCHHVHAPEITFTSDTTAEGIWPMEDELWWQNGDTEERLHGWGHYNDKYRKENRKWLICYRSLSRLGVEKTPDYFKRALNN